MIGSSYEGFTVVMALLNPHPALKVAAPESPMVDGWMGDDWFHYGAFREICWTTSSGKQPRVAKGHTVEHEGRDDYTNFLVKGSAGDFARSRAEISCPTGKRLKPIPRTMPSGRPRRSII